MHLGLFIPRHLFLRRENNMSNQTITRRRFLESAFYSTLLYGTGAAPNVISSASAAPDQLTEKVLLNLFLGGGPDMRHLIVPEYSADTTTFGGKYWANRQRSHRINSFVPNGLPAQTAQQRWNDDYYHITVGDSVNGNWSNSLVDINGLNDGLTFGIWKEAGWLIDMFRSGHVALIFNAVGGTNRAHDLSTLQLNQGNLLSGLNDSDRSGWGGRLARAVGGNSISLQSSPSPFNFGPVGSYPNYNPNAIDNADVISVRNSRDIGLFDSNLSVDQRYNRDDKMARAARSYYAGLRNELLSPAYAKFMDHEFKVREFGQGIQSRLEEIPIPELIYALRNNVDGINPGPDSNGNTQMLGRRVLRSNSFADQIRNLYDLLAINNLNVDVGEESLSLDPRVLSLRYGGWDSHADQRQIPTQLTTDANQPWRGRGIESGLRDIFEGQYGNDPSNSSALHGGLSALWESLNDSNLGVVGTNNIVLTIMGEFGRQIRDNDGRGTDHGKGNLMFVISESCNGGIYGEMFPGSEVVKYDEPPTRTPDIDPRTEVDHFLAEVCDWVLDGSGQVVFPRMVPGYADINPGTAPIIESVGMFNSLFS